MSGRPEKPFAAPHGFSTNELLMRLHRPFAVGEVLSGAFNGQNRLLQGAQASGKDRTSGQRRMRGQQTTEGAQLGSAVGRSRGSNIAPQAGRVSDFRKESHGEIQQLEPVLQRRHLGVNPGFQAECCNETKITTAQHDRVTTPTRVSVVFRMNSRTPCAGFVAA